MQKKLKQRVPPANKPLLHMSKYSDIFSESWRGCGIYISNADRQIILSSKASSYDDLYRDILKIKNKELAEIGGLPFYEPSTYYTVYREAHYHANAEWAARRHASNLFSVYSCFRAHKCTDIRILPEERSDYELKLWTILHPNPLTKRQKELWQIVNEVTSEEPYAWPMMIGLVERYYQQELIDTSLQVVGTIQKKFLEKGYTSEEFFEVQRELWKMFENESAKGM